MFFFMVFFLSSLEPLRHEAAVTNEPRRCKAAVRKGRCPTCVISITTIIIILFCNVIILENIFSVKYKSTEFGGSNGLENAVGVHP